MSRLEEKLRVGTPYFIAEMSANHGRDFDLAMSIVEAAAESGADCLKVQTYTADSITLDCDNEYFTVVGGLWDGKRLYDLYSEGSLPMQWHEPIRDRCQELGLDFLSTPFDNDGVDFLVNLGVDALKIASFELTDIPLIEYAASKGKMMIVSTGMASIDEISDAVEAMRNAGNDNICLLRCCSDYPADLAAMNLSSIADMRERFGVRVGFSDHSEGHLADVVAATLGASIIEKHFCLDRGIKTVDSDFSMTPAEYAAMVEAVNSALSAIGSPVYGPTEGEMHNLSYRRSIFAGADIAEGELFTVDNLRIVRPAQGAKPKYFRDLLGTKSPRAYKFGDPIVYEK